MSTLSTHVLDTGVGRPAAGMALTLERKAGPTDWQTLGQGVTNDDGRVKDLLPAGTQLEQGIYRMTFATGDYFRAQQRATFYPQAEVMFEVTAANEHYHVPLLISGFGFSTYRGS